ncbi:MAG: chromosome segregation protein SMC [Rhodobacteraceae bacterium]|nr:chromosome segregation protein SMC [Paracoccaceae bacterium]
MRFSKLRLNGFKSFVDPTDLVIADGLTGVVGPNGCGKSNLLEALRWVMGENRPTAMRGGGMEDVIFAGAATRPARNFAEVSVTIDNSDRLAPSGFNEDDQLEVVRRITRDIGSAYKANGKERRARDVQMLFADASTGSHSPSLVRQGQISELINAKPRARRRVLEEAAGISGLYQRRHEAELKLKGAEANLIRVDDVLEQLTTQLASLARQARQAARYREIGSELRLAEGMLLYRRWKEADEAREQAEAALRAQVVAAAKGEQDARQAMKAREVAEDAVPPKREEEAIAGAILQRLQVQRDSLDTEEKTAREAVEALEKRIAQLTHDIEREAALNKDAGETIERLEWEAVEIQKANKGFDEELAAAAEAARGSAAILQERESQLSTANEDTARLAARHQSALRFQQDSAQAAERIAARAGEAEAAIDDAKLQAARSVEALEAVKETERQAGKTVEAAEEALAKAEAERNAAQLEEAEAHTVRSEAEGEAGALKAEVQALARLVARESDSGNQVIDELSVAPGFEKALGAALADDLKAPRIVDGVATGWRMLPAYDQATALPEGAAPLASRVTLPDVLARRMAQVGVVSEEEGARLQSSLMPGQRLVSLAGDLWRWDGYVAAAADAPSAAALRLEQVNRLKALEAEEADAQRRAAAAREAHDALTTRLEGLKQADQVARQERRSADQQQADAARALSRAEADQSMAEGKVESLSLSVTRLRDEETAARAQLLEAERALAALPDLETARAELEDVKLTVEASRVTMLAHRTSHDELRRTGEARTKRSQEIAKELSGWRHRLETAAARSEELTTRKERSEAELKAAKSTPGEIAERREALQSEIEKAEARRKEAADALALAETVLRQAVETERNAERGAGTAREMRAAAEARFEAARETLEARAEAIREARDVTPDKLLEEIEVDPAAMPAADCVEADVARLRRQRDALGAVNLRAEEDAREVEEERDALATEKEDLEAAIATLRSGIASLNKEGRERLLAAFDEVNKNFSLLFTHLFGGGEAKLVLVESEDPLEAGLEIMCQPPGKKLSTLSLLSGGEQTLTALALIFAVFLANPAPICVLDEVDAPLDDANVTRFCDLLDEMTRRTATRFLIITHHAVTMSRMDRLFGVTMQEQGVSQLVSVDLHGAEKLVA